MLPFTREQFLGVFNDYNTAVWPAQVVACVLGLAVVAALFVVQGLLFFMAHSFKTPQPHGASIAPSRNDEQEPAMQLLVNNQRFDVPAIWHDESLLWVLREALALVGCKYGCGQGQCGACTVLVDGEPLRACLLPARSTEGRSITTIEGLARAGALHPVQQAWVDEAVPQCGYCQSGQIMATVALLRRQPRPDAAAIDAALAGHLCRCGTQQRVRRAVERAAAAVQAGGRS